jgi:hypothetical protein
MKFERGLFGSWCKQFFYTTFVPLLFYAALFLFPTSAYACSAPFSALADGDCRAFLTTTGSNQTFTSPSDWNNASNTIECIGAGGSGGARDDVQSATGGGGGAYSKISNFYFASPGVSQTTYQIGIGGTAITMSGAGQSANGNAGGDSWFGAATCANASVCAKGGGAGQQASGGSVSGGTGGAAASGVGTAKFSGGRGGNTNGANQATGGGGAAGSHGDGNAGGDNATQTAGGSGDAGSGGTAGAAGGTNGGNGSEWDATDGSGGGGGGKESTTGTAGSGGNYGGGGGGLDATFGTGTSGAGIQGLIVIIYTRISSTQRASFALWAA